ncbi:MAG TPA: hypothetical protein VK586_27125 [Streptosporangiaceae bacterium]|nr:hypothetical protein [Streptosporangiaceae bacterium]
MSLTRLCEFCLEAKAECVCPDTEAPATVPDEDAQYRGVIIIEWPPPGASPYSAMTGWNVAITDAVTGQAITTVMSTDITVHADAERMVTAALTMFADENSEPLLGGMPVMKDGEALTGVFPFLVSEMRVRDR